MSETAVTTTTEVPPQHVGPVGDYVRRQVAHLSGGYLANTSASVAALARLRHALGKPVGAVPEALWWTIAGLPESVDAPSHGPSNEELAAHTAITLFAVHQQSIRDRRMNTVNRSLGAAVGLLYRASDNKEGVRRRFQALSTASNWDEMVRHARGLIRMLNGARIPLDYGILAADLLELQSVETVDDVRMRWGRDFYRIQYRADRANEASQDSDESDTEN